jgi:arylsulfatase A-like enzyme
MVDQWRGDCLSIDGHPVVHTPYLDGLALRGARFSRAYSATPTCIPARAALFTGQSQTRHGRVGYRDGVPWDYDTTLAGEFTAAGYQTQAIGKMHVFPERSQLGFQNVILHDGFLHFSRKQNRAYDRVDDYIPWLRQQLGREADYFDHGVNCNSYVARPWDKDEALHPTTFVMTQAIDFLRRRDPRKPFFLFLSFHRPHPPYDPPAWAFDMYRDRPMPETPLGDWIDVLAPWSEPGKPDCFVGQVDPAVHQRARAGYYGHMTHIDHQINRFLETLGDYSLADDTYVCFTSDHGEMMGDHDLWRKAYPYEGSARVPLILAGPRDSGILGNSRHDQVAELRDVMPTLLDCAGLPIPPGVEGQSLLPVARGESTPWRVYLHGEHTVLGQSLHYVTDGHSKYVWYSGNGYEQLFDLDSDPQECHNLAGEPGQAANLAHWRQCLIGELANREEGFVRQGHLVPGQPVSSCLAFLRHQAGLEA